jgi:hypothetical protein
MANGFGEWAAGTGQCFAARCDKRGVLGTPWRTKPHVFGVLLSLLACVRRHDGGAMGATKHGSATQKTESAFLQSLKVAEVCASGDGWRGGRDVALLSETERIRAKQLVGANPCVEAWLSEVKSFAKQRR